MILYVKFHIEWITRVDVVHICKIGDDPLIYFRPSG